MKEESYSNREIREMFNDINKSLARIETQTSKTNGRVNRLENWRSYTAGAIGVIVLILVPALGWLTDQVIKLLEISR